MLVSKVNAKVELSIFDIYVDYFLTQKVQLALAQRLSEQRVECPADSLILKSTG